MLVRNFIPGHRKLGSTNNSEGSLGCVVFIIGAILLTVIGIKAYGYFKGEEPPPLFAEAPGLVITLSASEAETIAHRPLVVPEETFGAKIQAIGFYSQKSKNLPATSMSVILARDNWRFVEILERPGLTLAEALKAFPEPQQPIRLNDRDGYLVSVGHGEPKCSLAEDGYLGVCEIRRIIIFETELAVISIAADGTGVTDGELIEMARSIADKYPMRIIEKEVADEEAIPDWFFEGEGEVNIEEPVVEGGLEAMVEAVVPEQE